MSHFPRTAWVAAILAVLAGWAGAQVDGPAPSPPVAPPRAEVVVPEAVPAAPAAPPVVPPSGEAAPPAVPVPPPVTRGLDGQPDDPSQPVAVRIVSPRSREVIPTTVVDVFLEVSNYTLAENGNRLQVIVDNRPPVPWTDASRPFPLKGLTEGGHTVRVFAARPDGTLLRNPEAFAMVHFYVKRKDFQNYTDTHLPFLSVNLPAQGPVELDANGRLCFDYVVHNAVWEGDPQLRVRYRLDAYEGSLAEPGPVFWSNLQPGRHKLVVELYDRTNQPVFGPFNRVEREFEVRQVLRAVPVPAAEGTWTPQGQ